MFREGTLSISVLQRMKPEWNNYEFDSMGMQLFNFIGGDLTERMKTNLTWPRNIIVLEKEKEKNIYIIVRT